MDKAEIKKGLYKKFSGNIIRKNYPIGSIKEDTITIFVDLVVEWIFGLFKKENPDAISLFAPTKTTGPDKNGIYTHTTSFNTNAILETPKMSGKIFDLVLTLLKENKQCRNSDRALIWAFWETQGLIHEGCLLKKDFLENTGNTESIRRSRAQIQSEFRQDYDGAMNRYGMDLQSDEQIEERRLEIANQKGTHIYRDTANFY